MTKDISSLTNYGGYELGKWYLVQIGWKVFIPAKFIGLKRPCGKCTHTKFDLGYFPHLGEASFENVVLYGSCGFAGAQWEKDYHLGGGRYNGYIPIFREVTETELWAVQAIEKFQSLLTNRAKSFEIELPNGFKFQGKLKPPGKKDNLQGEYNAKMINPTTGEEKHGKFNYDGSLSSPREFLLKRLPGWHIVECKLKKPTLPKLKEKKEKKVE